MPYIRLTLNLLGLVKIYKDSSGSRYYQIWPWKKPRKLRVHLTRRTGLKNW